MTSSPRLRERRLRRRPFTPREGIEIIRTRTLRTIGKDAVIGNTIVPGRPFRWGSIRDTNTSKYDKMSLIDGPTGQAVGHRVSNGQRQSAKGRRSLSKPGGKADLYDILSIDGEGRRQTLRAGRSPRRLTRCAPGRRPFDEAFFYSISDRGRYSMLHFCTKSAKNLHRISLDSAGAAKYGDRGWRAGDERQGCR
jgi:hypothetical protein